jgi:phosphatidylglycerophosphate synthase
MRTAALGIIRLQPFHHSPHFQKGLQLSATRPISLFPQCSFSSHKLLSTFSLKSPSRQLPRTFLSLTSTFSNLLLYRQFSAPPRKPERHENIYTIPNILTFSRLLSTPIIAYLILHDRPYLATGLLLYAGLTDLIDGWIARRYNLKSVVGTVIDPMADKFLMVTLTGALAYTGGMPCTSPSLLSSQLTIVWLAVIILGRDVGLGIAALYYRYISLPPPKTFSRYWDFSLPSAEVHPTTISKVHFRRQVCV